MFYLDIRHDPTSITAALAKFNIPYTFANTTFNCDNALVKDPPRPFKRSGYPRCAAWNANHIKLSPCKSVRAL
jgi:hypothetical protein